MSSYNRNLEVISLVITTLLIAIPAVAFLSTQFSFLDFIEFSGTVFTSLSLLLATLALILVYFYQRRVQYRAKETIEMQKKYTREFTKDRRFEKNAKELLGEEVWEWLPKQPKNDIQESIRSLNSNAPTASMMMALRAVEYCLLYWYENKTGEPAQIETWGRVLSELEEAFDPEERPAVLSNIDYLRMKRNEITHPELTPDWSESESTLYMVRDTINEIYDQFEEEFED